MGTKEKRRAWKIVKMQREELGKKRMKEKRKSENKKKSGEKIKKHTPKNRKYAKKWK